MRAPGQEPRAGAAKRGAVGRLAEGGKQNPAWNLHQEPGPFRMEVLDLGLGWKPMSHNMAQEHLEKKLQRVWEAC